MSVCRCGCGRLTSIAKRNNPKLGHVKGQSVFYIPGHGMRGHHKRPGPQYVVADSGCWEWQHWISSEGYAQLWHNGQRVTGHRWFYERDKGPIPEGLWLDHLCRNRRCVNPDHLEPVTHIENCWRGAACKLTPDQAREIKRSSERGSDLAARYGVSQQTICDIRKGRKWAAA